MIPPSPLSSAREYRPTLETETMHFRRSLDLMRIGTGEITCLARTYIEADTLAEAVVAAIVAEANARPLTIARDYGDPYDGSQELVYRSTVSTTLTSG